MLDMIGARDLIDEESGRLILRSPGEPSTCFILALDQLILPPSERKSGHMQLAMVHCTESLPFFGPKDTVLGQSVFIGLKKS